MSLGFASALPIIFAASRFETRLSSIFLPFSPYAIAMLAVALLGFAFPVNASEGEDPNLPPKVNIFLPSSPPALRPVACNNLPPFLRISLALLSVLARFRPALPIAEPIREPPDATPNPIERISPSIFTPKCNISKRKNKYSIIFLSVVGIKTAITIHILNHNILNKRTV